MGCLPGPGCLVTATKSPMGYSLDLKESSELADNTEVNGSPVGVVHKGPLWPEQLSWPCLPTADLFCLPEEDALAPLTPLSPLVHRVKEDTVSFTKFAF